MGKIFHNAFSPSERSRTLRQLLREDWVLASLVFLVSASHLIQFRGSLDTLGISDEASILNSIQRIHYGELIYQDFFIFFPPLSFIILFFFVLPIFGMTFTVVRIFTAIQGGCIAFLTYIIARSLITRPLLALFPPLLFIFFGFHYWNNASHHWFGLPFLLSGLYCLQKYIQHPSRAYLVFLSGILGGLCLLSNQIDGVIFLVSGALFLFFRREMDTPHRFKDVFIFGTGMGACLAVFFIYAFFQGRMFQGYTSYISLIKAFGYDTLIWTVVAHRKWNALPQYFYFGNQIIADLFHSLFSPSSLMGFLLPFFGIFLLLLFGYAPFPALFFSAWTLISRRKKFREREQTMLLYFLTCLIFLLATIMTRPDPIRLIFFSPITFVLFFTFLEKGLTIPLNSLLMIGRITQGVKAICIFLLFVFGIATVGWGFSWAYSLSKDPRYEVKLPRGTVSFLDRRQAADFSSLVRFVNTHTKEGEYLYIHGYSPQYYFLLNRRNPISYDYLIPVYSTPTQIAEGMSQIKTRNPKYVLYDGKVEALMKDPSKNIFPALTVEDLKDNPMVEYIHSHYRPIMKLSSLGLSILERGSP